MRLFVALDIPGAIRVEKPLKNLWTLKGFQPDSHQQMWQEFEQVWRKPLAEVLAQTGVQPWATTDVDRGPDHIAFKVKRCPLKDAWVEAGVGVEKLATLCRIAGAFDRGLFEATGIRFANVTWTPGHGSGCCHIALANRDA